MYEVAKVPSLRAVVQPDGQRDKRVLESFGGAGLRQLLQTPTGHKTCVERLCSSFRNVSLHCSSFSAGCWHLHLHLKLLIISFFFWLISLLLFSFTAKFQLRKSMFRLNILVL